MSNIPPFTPSPSIDDLLPGTSSSAVPAEIPQADAYVIGSGPNGLAAAIVLAQAGVRVSVIEGAATVGGGVRSAALTLPGFVHDVCASVFPLVMASPFLRTLPLRQYGVEWVHPPAPLAHPLDDGSAVLLERSVEETGRGLGEDADAYAELMSPVVADWERLYRSLLGPPTTVPRHPLALARFAVQAFRSGEGMLRSRFRGERARALLGGMTGHSMLPLAKPLSAAFALVLTACGHVVGWPFPRGGAQKISEALAAHLRSLGGVIVTGRTVESLEELPPGRAVLCDVTPRQLLAIAGERLRPWFQRKLQRYRYGMAAYKVDWALDGPIPWRAPEVARAATVHLSGSMDEISRSELAAWSGEHAEKPFVILGQHTLFDSTRAPEGKHTAWAYCHVPNGSKFPMLERIEAQIERFAPGFRRRVLQRSVMTPAALEWHNPNLVGGDINGGAQHGRQLFFRPTALLYGTPKKGLYLCSSSTPPGGGVHGMCGFFAANLALEECF